MVTVLKLRCHLILLFRIKDPILIYYSSVVIHVMHPALVLFCISLPLFDFLFIFYFRIKNRLNPLKSDNFHFHHTLLKLNYNKYQIIMISSLISVFIFASGMLINFFIIKDFLILAIILYFAMYFIIMNKLQKNIKKALNRHH